MQLVRRSKLNPRYILLVQKQLLRASTTAWKNNFPSTIALVSPHLQDNFGLNELCDEIITCQDFSTNSIITQISTLKARWPSSVIFNVITNDEYCLKLCGEVREYFNLLGFQSKQVVPYLDKFLMKGLLANSLVKVPRNYMFSPKEYVHNKSVYLNQMATHLGFPLVAKPINEANNREVKIVNSTFELEKWAEEHATADNFELEEFIDGTLYHCNSIMHNNALQVLQIGEYANPPLCFAHGMPMGSITLPRYHELYNSIEKHNEVALTQVGIINNCITHLETFYCKRRNGFVFLEVAARAPGALVSEMSSVYNGHNLEVLNLQLQMGKVESISIKEPDAYCFWYWFPVNKGQVECLSEDFSLSSEHKITWLVKKK